MKNEEIKFIKIGDLEWSEDLGKMDWNDATKKCEELGGRLPTRIELIDLADNHKEDIKDWNNDYSFWSSTETYNGTAHAWYVTLSNGSTNHNNKTYKSTVRCVRSALEAKDKEWGEKELYTPEEILQAMSYVLMKEGKIYMDSVLMELKKLKLSAIIP